VRNGQLDPADIQTDKLGLFDDPEYIRGAGTDMHPKRQNVAALAASVSAGILTQFVSLTVAPGGIGAPGPLRYALSTRTLEHLDITLNPRCSFQAATATGDERIPLTGPHAAAQKTQELRRARQARPTVRFRRRLSALTDWVANRLPYALVVRARRSMPRSDP
jgi:hypothetical protein